MSEIINVREPHTSFDLTITDTLPEVFADGASQIMVGYPISKILFHTVVNPQIGNEGIEKRKGAVLLSVNTLSLLELCRNILAGAAENKGQFLAGTVFMQSKIEQILQGVEILPMQGQNESSKP